MVSKAALRSKVQLEGQKVLQWRHVYETTVAAFLCSGKRLSVAIGLTTSARARFGFRLRICLASVA